MKEKLEKLLNRLESVDLPACSRSELYILVEDAIYTLSKIVFIEEEECPEKKNTLR